MTRQDRVSAAVMVIVGTVSLFAGEIVAVTQPDYVQLWWLAGVAAMVNGAAIGLVWAILRRRWWLASAAVLFGILTAHLLYGPMYYRSSPISARLVSDASGTPVAGAVIAAEWRLQRPHSLESTEDAGLLHRAIVRSDATGAFRIARWGPRPRPLGCWLDPYSPTLEIATLDGRRYRVDEWRTLVRRVDRVALLRGLRSARDSSHPKPVWRDLELVLSKEPNTDAYRYIIYR